jgi:phage terminase large subunit
MEIKWQPTEKQFKAFEILQDKETTELLYGGAAGGGKTHLGCVWIAYGCLAYSGSRWLMGRAVLKHLKASTLLTFFDVLKTWGLKSEKDYIYNQMDGIIKFFNGSEVFLRELSTDPSDPEFDKLGSTEYTGAFIDECSQVSTKAKTITMSRIRYRLDEFKLLPKLLLCSNPTKNFLYHEFFIPFKNNQLPNYRKFLSALVTDNSYISKHYIENLKKMDRASKERLLYGNWQFDDDPSRLFEYENLVNMFTNDFVLKKESERFMTVDVARAGRDKTVIMLWRGFYIEKIIERSKQMTDATEREINELCKVHSIPRSHVAVDEDGVGGGIIDHLSGIRGFVNNSKPFERAKSPVHKLAVYNFGNLKSQCYFALADAVNANTIGIYRDVPVEIKEKILEDLEQIKKKDPDKDGRIYVTPKDIIKENIGRSPDFGDCMMMRMLFEVAKGPGFYVPE